MEVREFYKKRIKEEPTIGSVQLMEEYAKHILKLIFAMAHRLTLKKYP